MCVKWRVECVVECVVRYGVEYVGWEVEDKV